MEYQWELRKIRELAYCHTESCVNLVYQIYMGSHKENLVSEMSKNKISLRHNASFLNGLVVF